MKIIGHVARLISRNHPSTLAMMLRAIILLAVVSGAAALRTGTLRTPTASRAAVRLVEPVESPQDCVAAAESGEEAEECLLPLSGKLSCTFLHLPTRQHQSCPAPVVQL